MLSGLVIVQTCQKSITLMMIEAIPSGFFI